MRSVTGVAATDVITTKAVPGSTVATRHGFTAGTRVVFKGLAGGTGLTSGTVYYVVAPVTDTTFKVSLTKGGGAVDFTTDITAGVVRRRITAGNSPKAGA